ncbi:hypothetical protein FQR65_LT16943 [Abscondita terminalis]|nr:hypothetical protein FQR65_LT16943 [Abscondita terminalis]
MVLNEINNIEHRSAAIHDSVQDFNGGFTVEEASNTICSNEVNTEGCNSALQFEVAAFFHKETLYHHVNKCVPPNLQIKRSTTILSRKLLADLHYRANETLQSKVFPVLRDDDCVSVIKYDLLAILIGNHWCGKYPSQHHRDMIGNKLRSIGCLIFTARSLDSTVTDYASLLTPAKLDNSESEDDSNALQAANKLQSDILDNTSKAGEKQVEGFERMSNQFENVSVEINRKIESLREEVDQPFNKLEESHKRELEGRCIEIQEDNGKKIESAWRRINENLEKTLGRTTEQIQQFREETTLKLDRQNIRIIMTHQEVMREMEERVRVVLEVRETVTIKA